MMILLWNDNDLELKFYRNSIIDIIVWLPSDAEDEICLGGVVRTSAVAS